MKKKSGYTLMELIVVLAIIGILTAILVPTWTYMITNGRVRTANANAKAIFGAAQTAATERRAYERVYNDGYMTSNPFYFYWNGETGIKCNSDGTDAGATAAQNAEFAEKINKMIDNSAVYKIYIDNYRVQSVVAARFDGDKYIGAYPVTFQQAEDENKFTANGTSVDNEKTHNVSNIKIECFSLT